MGVKVSEFVANRFGKLTKSLASYLANKATPNTSVSGGSKKTGAIAYLVDAARGGLIGYGTVYNGLESSAKVLGNNVKDNSVKIVNHKYGGEAGAVFGDACTAAGNAAMTYECSESWCEGSGKEDCQGYWQEHCQECR